MTNLPRAILSRYRRKNEKALHLAVVPVPNARRKALQRNKAPGPNAKKRPRTNLGALRAFLSLYKACY